MAPDFWITNDLAVFASLLSALLSLIAFAPYIRDTLSRQTRPHRVSWLIWAVLSSISFAWQVMSGETSFLVISGVLCGATVFVFLLSIPYGAGQYVTGQDGAFLLAAGIGLCLWAIVGQPVVSLIIWIAISFLGGLATVIKAYRDPWSETLSCWVLSVAASGLHLLWMAVLTPSMPIAPLYLLVLYGAIVLAILRGRARAETLGIPRPGNVSALRSFVID